VTYRLPHSDLVAAGALLALSAVIVVVSGDFPAGQEGDPGPAFFPRFIAAAIALFALLQAAEYLRSEREQLHEIDPGTAKRLVVVGAFPVAYVLLMPFVGFLITTIGFLVTFMWYSGARSIPIIAGSSMGITLVLHYVFGVFFRVPLPEGIVPVARLLPSAIGVI
jgi:putative tricarboxylic transport membrane protein